MLELSDRNIAHVIEALASFGLEAGYLVPTETGLAKSILDAHAGLRSYLKSNNFHDYQAQDQGSIGKRIVDGFYVTPDGLKSSQVSLYRPETKTGDPRIWPYELKRFSSVGNLLAIFVDSGAIYIANVSDPLIMSNEGIPGTFFKQFLENLAKKRNEVASELLERIKSCTNGQWIRNMREGPTGVGFTLESLLGIPANNNRAPDYKGIELKAGRQNFKTPRSRSTLFSKTPDWQKSVCHSGLQLLDKYGYLSDGRKQLYCSLRNTPNSLGHFLEVTHDDLVLNSMHQKLNINEKENVLHWEMATLTSALAEKHRETFWIKAQSRKIGGLEEFRYTEVIHTKGPLLSNMVELFKLGNIELDYCLHDQVSNKGSRRVRDHGYLFKIWPKNFNQIFPPPSAYMLI